MRRARATRRKARRRAVANSVEVASGKLPLSSPDGSTKPPGQRLYDMPYSATAPRMINPESVCTTSSPGPGTTPPTRLM